MTNEEMAIAVKAGETPLLAPLWERVEKLIWLFVNKCYLKWEARCLSMGVERDDLHQQGYFALLAAVKCFDPEKGLKFTSYLALNCQRYFYDALGLRSGDWKDKPTPTSLDRPLGDEVDFTLMDTIPDADSERGFEEVLDRDYISRLRQDLMAAIADLPDKQKLVIAGLYFEGLTYREIGKSVKSIDRIRHEALRRLARHGRLKAYKAERIRETYGQGFGFRTFDRLRASPQERAVLELEKRGLL